MGNILVPEIDNSFFQNLMTMREMYRRKESYDTMGWCLRRKDGCFWGSVDGLAVYLFMKKEAAEWVKNKENMDDSWEVILYGLVPNRE